MAADINTIGFFGYGNLATKIISGCLPFFNSQSISVFYTKRTPLQISSDITFLSGSELVSQSQVIVIAVKPQQVKSILPTLTEQDLTNKCIISLCAGITLNELKKALPNCPNIARIMPNVAAKQQESMTLYSPLESISDMFHRFIINCFNYVGLTTQVTEDQMNIGTAMFGSGPAFFYKIIEASQHLLQQHGFSMQQSRIMLNQLITGVSASISKEESVPITTLIKQITSPNGTTQAGLETLSSTSFLLDWQSIIISASKRSLELSNEITLD